jgi:hypothetical protein
MQTVSKKLNVLVQKKILKYISVNKTSEITCKHLSAKTRDIEHSSTENI